MPQSDSSPSKNPFSITPADGSDLLPHRSVSIAVGGAVKVTNVDGSIDTLTLPAGMCPSAFKRIWSTGTTATGFVGYP